MKELMNYRYWFLLIEVGTAMVVALAPCSESKDFLGWIAYHLTSILCAVVILFNVMVQIDIWMKKGKLPLLKKIQELTTSIIDK